MFCADYFCKHKKTIPKQRNFRSVGELDLNSLKQILPPDCSTKVSATDYLCYHCFMHITKEISMRSSEQCPDIFVPAEEAIEDLNRSILPTDVSPLRQPSVVRSRDRPAYVKRKQTELEQVAVKNIRSRLRIAYDRDAPSGSSEPTCSTCTEWVDNFRQAFETATSLRERCQLLTLLPSTLTKNEVQKMIPQASMYLISKSRKLKEKHGVWYEPDPYTRCKVSPENLSAALEYFTKDELQCSRQSPNQKDVISVMLNGEKTFVPKRFMTRSIREAFRIYKDKHPDSGVGLTKFYSLRPRWVQCIPHQEVCVCVRCANYYLCIAALENVTGSTFNTGEMNSAFLCDPATELCLQGDCDHCPKGQFLTLQELDIPEDEEIVLATWESGDLVKKTLEPETFLKVIQVTVGSWVLHNHIRQTQGKAIYDEKQCMQRGSIVFHFDFAENWTIVLPDEVQAYHWKKKQVSIFTCVVTTRKSTNSFAIISEDLCHDAAHACLALEKVKEWVEDNVAVYSYVTYVSDGAASHFKNRYQLHQFAKDDCPQAQWLFSASGHGKNACDGVGGLVKHQATLNNLRERSVSAIQTARTMVSVLSKKLKGVHLVYLDENEVVRYREQKKRRVADGARLPWHSVLARVAAQQVINRRDL